jgi:hypothetical protein
MRVLVTAMVVSYQVVVLMIWVIVTVLVLMCSDFGCYMNIVV